MSTAVRGERPGDEDAIDLINCGSFGAMEEANIVRALRAWYPPFDRRFSVVAWEGEKPIGHALFSPARVRLRGETVTALAVGPVAVRPAWQRQGVGGELLRYGNDLGRREGFGFSFLAGHPSYYPRHGYGPAFGQGKITIDVEQLPPSSTSFIGRPVQPADVPWLAMRFEAEWADVDFAWLWGPSLGEFREPYADALMWWTEDGRRVAYTVLPTGHRDQLRLILADDPAIAREVVAAARPTVIHHHPSGWLAQHVVDPAWAKCEVGRSDAFMACELQEGVLEPCLRALEAGERPPGHVPWPLAF